MEIVLANLDCIPTTRTVIFNVYLLIMFIIIINFNIIKYTPSHKRLETDNAEQYMRKLPINS